LRMLKGVKLGKDDVIALHRELEVIDSLHGADPVARAGSREKAARTNAWRLVPTALGVVVFVALLIAAIGSRYWLLGVLAVLLPLASLLLGRSSARVGRMSQSAWDEVYQKQRQESVVELDELERRASRGVPGLSDRVSRALRILREQQG
jgi:hypothetical protein